MGAFLSAALPIVGNVVGGLIGGSAAKKGAKAIADANIAAEHGVLNASQDSQDVVNAAGQRAPELVNAATDKANTGLADVAAGEKANLDPYLTAGHQGVNSLADMAKKGFSFSGTDLQNDPGFKFQLAQGTNAIGNSAAARGLAASGNTLQALTQYGQGLASTYYNDAFSRAKSTFDTNVVVNKDLTAAGQTATNQYDQSQQNAGNQIAGNTIGAGRYGGDTALNVADYLAKLKTGAAKTAGDFAVGAGEATGAGIVGKGNAITGAISGVTNSLPGLIAAARQPKPPAATSNPYFTW
jgi:hypothetical protein